MNAEQAVFAIAGAISVVASVNAVFRRGPLTSALSLTIALFALAQLYLVLGAPFLWGVQLAVYAGAIMVLLIFVIMLLGASGEAPRVGGRSLTIGAPVLGAAVFALLASAILRGRIATGLVPPESADPIGALADELFLHALLPFEISSVLLLAALVAVVVLARKRSTEREWPGRR